MRTCFLFPFQNKYDQNVGPWWSRLFLAHFTTLKGWLKKFHISEIISKARLVWGVIEAPSAVWPPFSGWLQKFRNTDIVSLASPRVILEPPSVVFSVCQNRYQKLVFCWHVFWQMHKLQIHKLVSRCDHLNVSTMYSLFDWKEFEILSYRQVFLQSTEIRASEEPNALKKAPVQFLPLRKLSREVPVQFMPFRKLSGKCHFLVWFCTSKWSETYLDFGHSFISTNQLNIYINIFIKSLFWKYYENNKTVFNFMFSCEPTSFSSLAKTKCSFNVFFPCVQHNANYLVSVWQGVRTFWGILLPWTHEIMFLSQ